MPDTPVNFEPILILNPVIQTDGYFPTRETGGGYLSDTLGQIHFLATSYTGSGYGIADLHGDLMSIASNTALFSILGTTYGGDGMTTFGLPDLGGREVTGSDDFHWLGDIYGSPIVSLTQSNLPASSGGSSAPGVNAQPAMAIGWYINVHGIYPTESGGSPAMIGAINLFAGNFAPNGTMPCDGRLLPIAEYDTLFSLIGTTFGGDGTTNFALPDLRGRSPVGVGSNELGTYTLGDTLGSEDFVLTQANMPLSMGGSGIPVSNRGPGLVLTPLIAVEGLFTSFSEYDATMGEVTWFAGNFAPGGYAIAQGQLLPIAQNQALFALLGTTYGGNGATTFGLPNLTGRVVGGDGSWTLGDSFGYPTFSVTEATIPALSIYGGAGDNTLYGGPLGDTLNGGEGNDTLFGNGAGDTMLGGPGDDTFQVENSGDTVGEEPGQGHDRVRTSLSVYALPLNVEDLLGTLGTGQDLGGNWLDNVITGAAGNDILRGYFGNDTLDGGPGADAMHGNLGDDIFYVDNVGDTVTEYFDHGIDTIRTTLASYSLPAAVENLQGLSAGSQTLNGNQLDNAITGGAGNDTLSGYAGNDVIDGGPGDDAMRGNLGDDAYIVDSAGDTVTEFVNQGTDTVRTTLASYSLGAHVENLVGLLAGGQTLTGNNLDNAITGGAGADILNGYAGNDTLDGGGGADTMRGNLGNDTYGVDNAGDTVTEYFGEGTDTVRTSLASYTLGAHLENLTGLLSTGQALTGNNLDNTIVGGGGNDRLNGSLGADTLTGGAGADTFVFAYYPGTTFPYGSLNSDLVLDFASGVDRIELAASAFAQLSPGALSAAAFYAGTAAHDADDRIVYDAATGKLWYDPDGTGGQAAMLFATLGTGSHPATLAATDFVVA